jgi:xylitol oxidase
VLKDAVLKNWAGNVRFSTGTLHRPTSVEQLQELVAAGPRLRVLGTGHSFSRIADTDGALVSVADLPVRIELDADRGRVHVSAGVRYAQLAQTLDAAGFALHNLGSLPHISIGGAVATGTHGSGIANPNLASAVSAVEVVLPSGELVKSYRTDPDFDGKVVALGSLGVVTALTLDVQPRYEIEQYVYEALPMASLRENLLSVLGAAYSVSVFLTWKLQDVDQVWIKHRTDGEAWTAGDDWLGATLADGPRHPVPRMDPVNCTQQGGVSGPWHQRLPHFRADFTPSAGDELQTEYLLPIEHAVPILDALNSLADQIAPVLQVSELRTVAADQLWLSEAYRQDSLAVHFTWLNDPERVAPVIRAVESQLAAFGARPHWGKVFSLTPEYVAARYERFADAVQLIAAADPGGRFRNSFTNAYLPESPFSVPRLPGGTDG